jgi:tripartite-type tricarboxylate transporter receptor subunit TctC
MYARLLIAVGLLTVSTMAGAETFPSRPIKLVVPFAAGGPGDAVGRLLAQAMSRSHSVVVENVSGAGGNIGAARVAKAQPDGYTVLFHQLGMAISPLLYPKLDYGPLTDFEYIGLVAYQPNVLIARPSVPANTFSGLLAYLKSNRDMLAFANTGPGGASHLCAILFMNATQIDIKSVPYRATSLALTDLLGGQVDLLCDSVATATPYILSGAVKAYGVTGKTRAMTLPDVPTLDEQGLTGFDMVTWTALYAPRHTPKPAVDNLVGMLQSAVDDPQFKASLQRIGSQPMPKERAKPEALAAHLKQEMDRWAPIIKSANIRGE